MYTSTERIYEISTRAGAQIKLSIMPSLLPKCYDIRIGKDQGEADAHMVAGWIVDHLSPNIEMLANKIHITLDRKIWEFVIEWVSGDDSSPQYELRIEHWRSGIAQYYKIEKSGSYFKLWESALDRVLTD